MLFYTILLVFISAFFYREGKRMSEMRSHFLPDFNISASVAQVAAKQLFFTSICSAISGIIMLLCWIYQQITHRDCPKILLALSIIIYAGGFMLAMYRCYQLKKEIQF